MNGEGVSNQEQKRTGPGGLEASGPAAPALGALGTNFTKIGLGAVWFALDRHAQYEL